MGPVIIVLIMVSLIMCKIGTQRPEMVFPDKKQSHREKYACD